MINLGLVKAFNLCPAEIPRLSFRLPAGLEGASPVLKSWLEEDERIWELIVAREDQQSPAQWAGLVCSVLQGLGKPAWCVNTHDLIQVFRLPLDRALEKWGETVWPMNPCNCVLYFKTGQDREILQQIFAMWVKKHTNVCFRSKYDLSRYQPPRPETPPPSASSRIKSIIKTPADMLRTGRNL
ncbi:MAG: hypothetical protein ACOCV7_03020 [Desulfonatronovibrionaceae bacterium]